MLTFTTYSRFMFSVPFLLIVTIVTFCSISSISADVDTPSQIHLAIGGPESFSVTWFTVNEKLRIPRCFYGVTQDTLTMSSKGSSVVYLRGYGAHHSVILSGLNPDQQYFYQCGDVNSAVTSAVLSFKTPTSSTGNNTDQLSFLIFGGKSKNLIVELFFLFLLMT